MMVVAIAGATGVVTAEAAIDSCPRDFREGNE